MTVSEEYRRYVQADIQPGGMASKKTDDVDVMQFGWQFIITQQSVKSELQTPIATTVYYVLAQGLNVLGDVAIGEYYSDEGYEPVKEGRNSSLEVVNAYKIGEKKIEKTKIKNIIALKEIKRSVAHLETRPNSLGTKKSVHIKMK